MNEIIKIYASGPIAGCDDASCKDWREYLKEKYCISRQNPEGKVLYSKRYIQIIDPMRRDYRHLSRDMKMSTFEDQKKIVTLDKADIRRSDAMIVWTGKPFPSVGTSMEVMYAFDQGVYTITVNPNNDVLSPWLYYHSHKIVLTLDDAIDNIQKFFNEE